MSKIIKLKIDVSKIDKNRLFKGTKGTYLDCTLFLKDEPDEFGNFGMITQEVTKDERTAGVKGNILGNATKVFVQGQQAAPAPQQAAPQPAGILPDLPF